MCAYMYIDCGMFYHMYIGICLCVHICILIAGCFTICICEISLFLFSQDKVLPSHCAQKDSSKSLGPITVHKHTALKNLGFNYQAQCTHLSDICEVVVPLVAGARGARPCATTRRCGSNRRCAIGRSSSRLPARSGPLCPCPSFRAPAQVPFSELVVHQFYQRRKAAEQLELWPLYGWPDLGEVLLVQQVLLVAEVAEQPEEMDCKAEQAAKLD